MGCQSLKGPQATSGQNFYCSDDNLLPREGEGLSWDHKEVEQDQSHGWPSQSTTLYSDRYRALLGAPKCPGHRGPQVTLGRHATDASPSQPPRLARPPPSAQLVLPGPCPVTRANSDSY